MDITHGLGMFFIGVPITIIGFFIAYTVAYKSVMDKDKKEEPIDEEPGIWSEFASEGLGI